MTPRIQIKTQKLGGSKYLILYVNGYQVDTRYVEGLTKEQIAKERKFFRRWAEKRQYHN